MQYLLSTITVLALLELIQAQDVTVCGPFELVSNTGAILDGPNGIQFTGPSLPGIDENLFKYSYTNGSLFRADGAVCIFDPYWICNDTIPITSSTGFLLSQPYSELNHWSNNSFYLCPAAAVKRPDLNLTATTITYTITRTTQTQTGSQPTPTETAALELKYIFNTDAVDYLDIGTDPFNKSQCLELRISGSSCDSYPDYSFTHTPAHATATATAAATPNKDKDALFDGQVVMGDDQPFTFGDNDEQPFNFGANDDDKPYDFGGSDDQPYDFGANNDQPFDFSG